jgi:hypothetical protein
MARRARAKDARRLWRYMPLNLRSVRVSCTSTSVDEGVVREEGRSGGLRL